MGLFSLLADKERSGHRDQDIIPLNAALEEIAALPNVYFFIRVIQYWTDPFGFSHLKKKKPAVELEGDGSSIVDLLSRESFRVDAKKGGIVLRTITYPGLGSFNANLYVARVVDGDVVKFTVHSDVENYRSPFGSAFTRYEYIVTGGANSDLKRKV